jgi:signal transduction histidine kinase
MKDNEAPLMSTPLHVLILEDLAADAELIIHELERADFDPLWVRVQTEQEYETYLHAGLDLIVADYTLPQFNALVALRILKAHDLDIPFIVITGTVSEEVVAEVMREGAADYLLKDRPARLGQSVRHALEQKRLREEKRTAQEALRRYNVELEATIHSRTAELEQALAKEREVNELKARFVSMISHEFRTPLAIIQSASDILNRYESQITLERKREELEEIQHQIRRLTTLLDEILTISRSQSVGLQLQRMPVDIETLIAEVAHDMEPVLSHRELQMMVQGVSREVSLDYNLMKQVIGNLISNAAKFSPDSSCLNLNVNFQPRQVVIQVTDEGIGIPEEDCQHIFDLFHRARNAINIPGTGLGLAIVKQVMDAHGGQVRVESHLGHGTTFTLTLPTSEAVA